MRVEESTLFILGYYSIKYTVALCLQMFQKYVDDDIELGYNESEKEERNQKLWKSLTKLRPCWCLALLYY